ncbi:MAG TPA: YetF domain-containing protein [Candidatus Limnocylindria bacterium]|nr:YetF domain-containing protein [Candidatus Limnocylindria bacterium]
MIFSSLESIARTLVVGVAAYLALVVILRIAGKRALSRMNAFDLVVSVALGSTLATMLLSKDVALAEGILAFALLVTLQWVIAWSSRRYGAVARAVKAEPTLLFIDGAMLHGALGAQRVMEEEVLQAVRSAGHASLDAVAAVVLETDGSFSVMSRGQGQQPTALRNVARRDAEAA